MEEAGIERTREEHMSRALLVAALVALGAGCDSPTARVEERLVGIIDVGNSGDPQIVLPDTVAPGETFRVDVRTYGLNGCWRRGDTEVKTEPRAATVTPFDFDGTALFGGCAAAILYFTHTVQLAFEEPGAARVTVRGRGPPSDSIVAVDRTVVVR